MRQESVIKSIAEGFCRELIQDYASCYCKVYYDAKGEFQEILVGVKILELEDLKYPQRQVLETINQVVKERIDSWDDPFYIRATVDKNNHICVNIIFERNSND